MSIQVLARKAKALYYKNHSVGPEGFSINGPTRLPGIIPTLGRSQTTTPFKGVDPVGHGGGARCRVKNARMKCSSNRYERVVLGNCAYTVQTTVKPSTQTASMYTRTLNTMCPPIVPHRTFPNLAAVLACVKMSNIDSSDRTKVLTACLL